MIRVMSPRRVAGQNGGMPEFPGPIHVAGVVVRGTGPALRAALARVAGVEIHTSDTDQHCYVVTIEGATADSLRATHDAIAVIPGVTAADLICHLADEADRPPVDTGAS